MIQTIAHTIGTWLIVLPVLAAVLWRLRHV
jgi:hypothetical protein